VKDKYCQTCRCNETDKIIDLCVTCIGFGNWEPKPIIDSVNSEEIKDSGERTNFNTGAVRDMHRGKGRYDLLPWEAIHELALHCEEGAIKYGERNCEKGIPIHSLIDSAIRHLSCYSRGMKDEPHLRAALWNISFAIWTEIKHPEMQDIPERLTIHTDFVD